MNKKEMFYALLRKYGVSEYWCDPYFDPARDHPAASLLLGTVNPVLSEKIDNLYNDYSNEDTSTLAIYQANIGSRAFKAYSSGMERRVV